MGRIAASVLLIGLSGCLASERQRMLAEKGDPEHPLYVGRGDSGEIVVAASHYDAMNGLAVAAADIGAKEGDLLICAREMLTGTHVPKWVCRFPREQEMERAATQNWLDTPRNCIAHCGSTAK